MARLKIKDENGKERLFELSEDVVTIGRASTNQVQVTDEKSSRQHFKIEKDGGRFKVIDLGSTNGTRLNGSKITAATYLRAGDELNLGKTFFKYEAPEEEKPAPVAEPERKPEFDRTVEMDPLPPQAPAEPTKATEPKFVLKVLEGKNPGHLYEMGAKAVTLGRHANNTIQITDDAASNYHAEINREPIGYVLSDLGSTNGTRIKVKNKTEFDKVVKTPLSPGMQIRVGKTVLEFQNIGAPVEDEALFGTVSLDPQKLEEHLSPGGKKLPKALLAIVALALIGSVVALVVLMGKKSGDPVANEGKKQKKTPGSDGSNLVQNGDFQNVEDTGTPSFFSISKIPDVKVAVIPEADRTGDSSKTGLQVTKAPNRGGAAVTTVETDKRDAYEIDPAKQYEIAGWMKNDGDGLYGLRVTWSKDDRMLSEHHSVLAGPQKWQERKTIVTPPPWANRARVGIFVHGKEGKAQFDDISFRQLPEDAEAQPSVRFKGIDVSFEGGKGAFSLAAKGERVLEDGNLLLVTPDGATNCDLASAFKPESKKEEAGFGFVGKLYDFALQEFSNYQVRAWQGQSGVEMLATVDSPNDAASRAQLRFVLVSPISEGPVEASSGGTVTQVSDGNVNNAQTLLFNAGKTKQLFLTLKSMKPIDVTLKTIGKRREVAIKFAGDLELSWAAENTEQRKKLLVAIDEMKKAKERKSWGDAETKMKSIQSAFGGQFPEAQSETAEAKTEIDAAWKAVLDDIDRALEALKIANNEGAASGAKDAISRHLAAWTGSPDRVQTLQENLKRIDDILSSGQNVKAEQEAEVVLKRAETSIKNGNYQIGISLIQKKILEDPVYSKTKIVQKAKTMLEAAVAANDKQTELNAITDALNEKVKNLLTIKDYKAAINAVENDKRWQDNKANLPEIEKQLGLWRDELKKKQ